MKLAADWIMGVPQIHPHRQITPQILPLPSPMRMSHDILICGVRCRVLLHGHILKVAHQNNTQSAIIGGVLKIEEHLGKKNPIAATRQSSIWPCSRPAQSMSGTLAAKWGTSIHLIARMCTLLRRAPGNSLSTQAWSVRPGYQTKATNKGLQTVNNG